MKFSITALSREIDEYALEVKEQTEKGELDIPIDSTSLLQFLTEYFKGHDMDELSAFYASKNAKLIEELSDFGLKNLKDVDMLLSQKTVDEWLSRQAVNYLGILRAAMLLQDTERYFQSAWKNHWSIVKPSALAHWKSLGIDTKNLEQYVILEEQSSGSLRLKPRQSD